MLNNIEEFMQNIGIIDKNYAIYEDKDKGIYFPLNTVQLLARVDYLELDENQYKAQLFEKKIEDLKYPETEADRATSKDKITGKDEDKTTIVNQKVKVKQVWNVINSLGVHKSFTNKDEALVLAKKINDNIFNNM